MITPEEEQYIIQLMTPFEPKKLGITSFQRNDHDLSIVYDFKKSISYFQLMDAVLPLETYFNKTIHMIHYDAIFPPHREKLLQQTRFFFDDQKRDRKNTGATIAY
ncbi:MAG: hypothetical protein OXE77_10505 [Flavobacteriaceae bacterium]|nr:hypothetical protein [Flavobacteriaceae bacterium]MCY4268177.1 hypothetical protein [Flavobacteriaceae bacterium]MCY4299948.1 hypothetical protein [Flavobacteriaceae bacterium]